MQNTNCKTRDSVVLTQCVDKQVPVSSEDVKLKKERKNPKKMERNDPVRQMACLLKKQKKAMDRLSSVDPSETRQSERLQKRLAKINAKIEQFPPSVKSESKDPVENTPSADPATVKPESKDPVESTPQLETPLAERVNEVAVIPQVSKTVLKEASRKYSLLRKDVKTEKLKVKNFRKVLAALKVLSRGNLGEAACHVLVDVDQVKQMKSNLDLARNQLSEKKQLAKDQSRELKCLVRLFRQMEHTRHHRKEKKNKNEKRCKKEKRDKKEKRCKKEKRDNKEKRDLKDKRNKRVHSQDNKEC